MELKQLHALSCLCILHRNVREACTGKNYFKACNGNLKCLQGKNWTLEKKKMNAQKYLCGEINETQSNQFVSH